MFEFSSLNLYDSANGKTILADKVIDITSLCKNREQVILKFANSIRGRIVQICDLYEAGVDMGILVHYFVGEYEPADFEEELKLRAAILGCDVKQLVKVILENA
jgi:hypothetical protein